jgi:hypothetical protein
MRGDGQILVKRRSETARTGAGRHPPDSSGLQRLLKTRRLFRNCHPNALRDRQPMQRRLGVGIAIAEGEDCRKRRHGSTLRLAETGRRQFLQEAMRCGNRFDSGWRGRLFGDMRSRFELSPVPSPWREWREPWAAGELILSVSTRRPRPSRVVASHRRRRRMGDQHPE